MTSTHRTLAGAAVTLLAVPLMLGIMACLPVPVGDPEDSRIDPELNGVWAGYVPDGYAYIQLLEPFDKRTWLVTWYWIDIVDDDEAEEPVIDDVEGLLEHLASVEIAKVNVAVYKAWRVRLGKHWFVTWESKGIYEGSDGFEPDYWLIWRIERDSPDRMNLHLINPDFEGFDGVDKTRSDFERVITKHSDDDDLYGEDSFEMMRVEPERVDGFDKYLDEAVFDPD